MKRVFVTAVALAGLGGCVAVPAHHPADAYYYTPAPAVSVGVGVYPAPVYRTYRPSAYYYPRYHSRRHHSRW
jgi:hypothetical protein